MMNHSILKVQNRCWFFATEQSGKGCSVVGAIPCPLATGAPADHEQAGLVSCQRASSQNLRKRLSFTIERIT